MTSIAQRIATELGVRVPQVDAAVALLDGKATVPFIARYRKEATGGLDDTQLRLLEERLAYLRELEDRRAVILKSIEEQGKLTPALTASLAAADSKARLEDLYLPYKPKRRTKAQIAREAGLEPLALALLTTPALVPDQAAAAYVSAERGVADTAAALEGARAILMERFAEDAELVGGLRQWLWERGEWVSTVVAGKEEEGAKFADYFNAAEAVRTIPAHRALALLRGRKEGILRLAVKVADDSVAGEPERRIAARAGVEPRGRPADPWLVETVRWTWKFRLLLQLEIDTEQRLRETAETEAIRVFGSNLHDLLLASPAGQRVTLGLDPGIRTGVKAAAVDGTGKLLATATVYPHEPRKDWDGALRTLGALCTQHRVELIAIGNGTASRETDRLAGDLLARHPELPLIKVTVSEAGASVYSASELAAREFPDLDVSLRGAVSIARRLQDPLAELVRIEPKAIGVGQYQHDVSPHQLARKLDAVVEDCVNAVGADVNTASTPLLARISGLNESLARHIVAFRDEHGPFRDRRQVLEVPRLGERTYQQAAGFLRITNGDNPLDASAVHPEAYPVVKRIVARTGVPIGELMGNATVLRGLRADEFADATFGTLTVKDILAELEKPGRDPRPEFRTAAFKDSVQTLQDLVPGMRLEGVVTNVANFGAFVDIGVHQDGLVHVSQLADRFVKDPREVVKAGDIVTVTVVEVDLKRRRIALTMKQRPAAADHADRQGLPAAARPAADARPAPPARATHRPAPTRGGSPVCQSRRQPRHFDRRGLCPTHAPTIARMSVAPATRPAPVAGHAAGGSIGQGLLLAMAVASGVTVANLYYIQPLLAEIGGTLKASAPAMGLVATLGQLGFATGLLFFVPLGDITDRRALIVATMAGAVVSLLATAVAPSYGWLAASVFCLGVFSVTPQMLVPFAAHLAAPEARGRAVGIVMSGLLIGILLSRTASGIISATAGWRTMYWIASALTLIVAAGMAAILPRGAGTSQLSYGRLLASLWQLTRMEPVLRESAFAGAMFFGAFSAFWSMLSFRLAAPPFHYGSEMAGLFGLVGVAGAAAAPVAGRLADRLNPRGIVRLSLIVTVSAFVVLAVLDNTIAGLVVGVILLDAGVQAGHVTNLARVHALAPETRNRLTTIYMVTFFIGGAFGSAMAAYAWSHWGWNGVCAVGLGMPLLALIALCRPVPELTTPQAGTL